MQKVSIIIPIYNEKKDLLELLNQVDSANFSGLEKEIILVDDFSTDGTREILKTLKDKYKIYYHDINKGKGAAIQTALNYVTGDYTVIQDADLEYSPDDYDKLLPLLINKEAEVVYGSRFLNKENNKNFMLKNKMANIFLTALTNVLYGSTISDMETCYKAFKTEIIKNIKINSNRFDFEPEITAKILKKKYILKEVAINYKGRSHQDGKKINYKDGFSAILTLIKYKIFN